MDTITINDMFKGCVTLRLMDVKEVYIHSYDWVIVETIQGQQYYISMREYNKVQNQLISSTGK